MVTRVTNYGLHRVTPADDIYKTAR